MTKQEIINAILSDKNVYWINKGYEVIYNNNHLYTVFKSNGSICGLQECEYKDCFIGV